MKSSAPLPPVDMNDAARALEDPATRRRLARAIARALRALNEESSVRDASRRSGR